jgi:hypothetical protein
VRHVKNADALVRGDGVAAYCAAHLLQKARLRVVLEPAERPTLPAIVLSDQALALVRDVFAQPRLFEDRPRITRRVIAWGPGAEPVAVRHSARVVSEDELLQAIRPVASSSGEGDWLILATRPLPVPAMEHRFGSRRASIVRVTLRGEAKTTTCWIESLDEGWLFLIPNPPEHGWLLAIGAAPEVLASVSRLVARQIAAWGNPSSDIPSYVRIAEPLGGPGWLACGTAAMTFDPICGDGAAHAIREAILAVAVVRAALGGGDVPALLAHYEARLTAACRRHLALCRGFYQSGGTGPQWRVECDAIDRGIRWCDARLASRVEFRYRLRGFELEAVK